MTSIDTTLGALFDAEPALRRVSEQDGLTEKTKYHVTKLARLVAVETAIFKERRQALFVELGHERPARTPQERAGGPTMIEIPPDRMPEFHARMKELVEVPVTIAWAPLRSVDLPQAKASDRLDLGPLCELVEPE